MRKISSLALLLLLAGAARPAQAQNLTECYQGPVVVDVNLDYISSHDDTTQTAVQIDSSLRNDPDSTLKADRRGIYVGVTKSKLELKDSFEFGGLINARQDAVCPSVKKVTYTITYRPAVYIASDFLRMACRYGVTVMHEQRHVNAYLQSLNEYIPQIKQAAEDYISHMPPKKPTTQRGISDRRQEIMKEITISIGPVLEKFKETNRQRQAEIDSPENYAHDDAICPGERPAFPGE